MHKMPKHVALIMDGNKRWARGQNLPVIEGHRRGIQSLEGAMKAASEAGVTHLTAFGFSLENWQRPQDEVSALMDLLYDYLTTRLDEFCARDIALRIIGERTRFSPALQECMQECERRTMNAQNKNKKMTLTIALSYGARQDITSALQKITSKILKKEMDIKDIKDEMVSQHLATQGLPPLDLLIRTSGEWRLSNFMLWESSYSELYFTETLWPEFGYEGMKTALENYARRERRYGL